MTTETKSSTKYGLVDRYTGAWLSTKNGMTQTDSYNALAWDSADDAKSALAEMLDKYRPDQGHGRLNVAQLPA